jgi:membrane protein implicated in regulation of membrane protease activity
MFTLTVLAAATEGPAPEDVKAGWVALVVFLLLALAVAFLGWSLVKQLRKAQAAKDAGAYGDEPVSAESDEPSNGDSSASV